MDIHALRPLFGLLCFVIGVVTLIVVFTFKGKTYKYLSHSIHHHHEKPSQPVETQGRKKSDVLPAVKESLDTLTVYYSPARRITLIIIGVLFVIGGILLFFK